jgi:hypothetical protein
MGFGVQIKSFCTPYAYYTCERSKFEATKTHFDTNHHLTIVWDAASPDEAAETLKATIRATLPQLAKQRNDDV